MFDERKETAILAMLERLGYIRTGEPMYLQADAVWSAYMDGVVTEEFRDYFLTKNSREIFMSDPFSDE